MSDTASSCSIRNPSIFSSQAVQGMEDDDDITVRANNLSAVCSTIKKNLQSLTFEDHCSVTEACSDDDSVGSNCDGFDEDDGDGFTDRYGWSEDEVAKEMNRDSYGWDRAGVEDELERNARERMATKSDNAAIPIYLWKEHLLKDGPTPWVPTEGNGWLKGPIYLWKVDINTKPVRFIIFEG